MIDRFSDSEAVVKYP